MTPYQKWQRFAPLGLALSGLGATVTTHASILKGQQEPTRRWFITGTVGLCIFNAGIAVFGEAIKARVLYELSEYQA